MKQAAEAVVELDGSGLSLIEISHRSPAFVAVMEEARSLAKELLGLPDRFDVLFLQGGASLAFLTAAYNFLPEGGSAAYLDTGTWASKAIKEAARLGQVHVVGSSKASNHDHIPAATDIPAGTSYLHYTTNNTIFGTQTKTLPAQGIPLIADMSSDIFSKPIDADAHQMIYAGAQKNMGPAGTVFYAIDKEALGKTGREIPAYLDLATHLDKDSMFNTPPVFAIYTTMLVLRWVKALGGVEEMSRRNTAKADLLYSEIDRNGLFEGHAQLAHRSQMNVTFRLKDEAHNDAFNAVWQAAGINGLKGHRSVGGFRASMYNALPLESVQILVDAMNELERTRG
jgi:phosphoserine aminotransferase